MRKTLNIFFVVLIAIFILKPSLSISSWGESPTLKNTELIKKDYGPKLPREMIPDDMPALVREQVERLYSSHPAERINAAKRLQQHGSSVSAAVPYLIGMLDDHSRLDTYNRLGIMSSTPALKAVHALGEIGDKIAIEPIQELLNNDIKGLKRSQILYMLKGSAQGALKKLNPPEEKNEEEDRIRTVPEVVALLRDKDWKVRKEAANYLKWMKMMPAYMKEYVPSNEEEKLLYYTALLNRDELVKLGKPAADALMELVNEEDVDEHSRGEALRILGDIGDKRAVDLILTLIKDDNSAVLTRKFAALALGNIGDKRAIPILESLYKGTNTEFKYNAIDSLGKLGYKRSIEELITDLDDENKNIREGAARELGDNIKRDKRAIEVLVKALKHEDSIVARIAFNQLRKAKWKPRNQEEEIAYLSATGNYDNFIKFGEGGVESIVAMMKKRKSVYDGIKVLKKIVDDKRLKDILLEVIKYEGFSVRVKGKLYRELKLLGWQDTNQDKKLKNILVLKALDELDKQERPSLRENIVRRLEEIGGEIVIEPLMKALVDDYFLRVRDAAADALGKVGKPAVKQLIVALNDKAFINRGGAVEALGAIGGDDVVKVLIDVLADEDTWVREKAKGALDKIDSNWRKNENAANAVSDFIKLLNDSNTSKKGGAIFALSVIGDTRAVEPLITHLNKKNIWIRMSVVSALGKLGDKRAVGPLTYTSTNDDNEEVRNMAMKALEILSP
jgi:HEAT repeat protein